MAARSDRSKPRKLPGISAGEVADICATATDVAGDGLARDAAPYDLKFPGPVDLPFDHDDVRVLRRQPFHRWAAYSHWRVSPARRSPDPGSPSAWPASEGHGSDVLASGSFFSFCSLSARRRAATITAGFRRRRDGRRSWRCVGRCQETCRQRTRISFDGLHQLIEQHFQEWMVAHYGSLHSLSFLPRPAMLHQIPRYMAHRLAGEGTARGSLPWLSWTASAMDQWAVVRQEMPYDNG